MKTILVALFTLTFSISYSQELRFSTIGLQPFVQDSNDSTGWIAEGDVVSFISDLIILKDRSTIVQVTADSTSVYLVQKQSHNKESQIVSYDVQSNRGNFFTFNHDKAKNKFAVTYISSDGQVRMNYLTLASSN